MLLSKVSKTKKIRFHKLTLSLKNVSYCLTPRDGEPIVECVIRS